MIFFPLYLCLHHLLWLYLEFSWSFQGSLFHLINFVIVSLDAWAHFPSRLFYLYHIYCLDFFSIELFKLYSFVFLSIDLLILFSVQWPFDLLQLHLSCIFFSFFPFICLRFHPFLLPVLSIVILASCADQLILLYYILKMIYVGLSEVPIFLDVILTYFSFESMTTSSGLC